jgi:hypothetical protein
MSEQNQKLAFLVTELGYFCSHRLTLALAAEKLKALPPVDEKLKP